MPPVSRGPFPAVAAGALQAAACCAAAAPIAAGAGPAACACVCACASLLAAFAAHCVFTRPLRQFTRKLLGGELPEPRALRIRGTWAVPHAAFYVAALKDLRATRGAARRSRAARRASRTPVGEQAPALPFPSPAPAPPPCEHELLRYHVGTDDGASGADAHICNSCGTAMFGEAAEVWRCQQCDYDLCDSCHDNAAQESGAMDQQTGSHSQTSSEEAPYPVFRPARFDNDSQDVALFITRSSNANMVLYRARWKARGDGLDPSRPMEVYWNSIEPSYRKKRQAKGVHSDRVELNMIEKRAFGVKHASKGVHPRHGVPTYQLTFDALKSEPSFADRVMRFYAIGSTPLLETDMGAKGEQVPCRVERIHLTVRASGLSWKVEAVDLYGYRLDSPYDPVAERLRGGDAAPPPPPCSLRRLSMSRVPASPTASPASRRGSPRASPRLPRQLPSPPGGAAGGAGAEPPESPPAATVPQFARHASRTTRSP